MVAHLSQLIVKPSVACCCCFSVAEIIKNVSLAMETMRVPVRQMSGKVVVLEVTPDTTIRQFKKLLEGWHPSQDELTRKISTVDVIVGGEKLLQNDKTLREMATFLSLIHDS